MVYTLVVYITYNMGNRDLPDIYALARGPQANPSCLCYNLYIYINATKSTNAKNKNCAWHEKPGTEKI